MKIMMLKIFLHCKEIGCCLKCSLRLAGTNFSTWKLALTYFTLEIKSFNTESLTNKKPCVICLGILQNQTLLSLLSKIQNYQEISNYDSNTISLSFIMPSASQIRERTVFLKLSKNFKINENFFQRNIFSIKEVWNFFLTPKIKSVTKKKVQSLNDKSPLIVETTLRYSGNQEECIELVEKFTDVQNFCVQNKKTQISKKTIDLIINTPHEKYLKSVIYPPTIPWAFVDLGEITCKSKSIFIAGRYQKLSRLIPQTPWSIPGQYKNATCIEELIIQSMTEFTKAQCAKFLSSGREDVDVRMLFFGRPFAVELINPKVTKLQYKDLNYLSKTINSKNIEVQISRSLKLISKENLKVLKVGEYKKSKTYRALCICKKLQNTTFIIDKLNTIKNFKILQKTPIRVLHRRCFSARQRSIYECRARQPNMKELLKYCEKLIPSKVDCSMIVIDLKTQAGTYVKEFIHGDFGRTFPNLCFFLKTEIDIIALDVIDVALNWP